MDQPLIFRKQIVSIVIIVLLLMLSFFINTNNSIKYVLTMYLILVFNYTLTPSLRGFRHSRRVRHFLFYFTFFIPVLLGIVKLSSKFTLLDFLCGLLTGLLLIGFNWGYFSAIINGKNIRCSVPLTTEKFWERLYPVLIVPIGEEVFFRVFLTHFLVQELKVAGIFIAATIFMHSHYINRWADRMFNWRSYIFHFLVGVSLGGLYTITQSVLSCILAHLLFNSSELILLLKQRNNQNMTFEMFNDYD